MEATMTPPETTTDARIVEGSNGMLLEIDGQIVPNYDATIVPFDEGDVVTGQPRPRVGIKISCQVCYW